MQKKTKKNKTFRDSKTNPGLEKSVNLKRRQDLIDYDYLHKLSKEELSFLNKFTEETVSASFKKNKDGKYSGNIYKKPSLKERTFWC